MQSGELIVVGQDKVQITLKRFPSTVIVDFKDQFEAVPCNPTHHDELSWDVSDEGKKIILTINWKVSSVREITWVAYY